MYYTNCYFKTSHKIQSTIKQNKTEEQDTPKISKILEEKDTKKVGYVWYIKLGSYGVYYPTETVFDTYEKCVSAVYTEYKNGYYGVKKVNYDEYGWDTIQTICEPRKTFYEDKKGVE
jgi:hypothetical protein